MATSPDRPSKDSQAQGLRDELGARPPGDPTSQHLELSFRPSFEQVATVRCFVEELCANLLGDEETPTRLAIATHELLENVVKYSADGATCLKVEITEQAGSCVASVVTRNRAGEAHLRTLHAYLEEMNASADPLAYYQQRMRSAALRADVSQLGLARIHVEADMKVSCSVDDDCLTVRAEACVR